MKYFGKLVFSIIISLLIFGLIGCSQQNSSNKSQEEIKKEQQLGKAAKEEIIEQVKQLVEQYNKESKPEGYLSQEEFIDWKKDFNILTISLNSSKIDVNDTKDINKKIGLLNNHAKTLSTEAALKAKTKMHSGKTIYLAAFKEDFHYALTDLDLTTPGNEVNMFISEYDESGSMDNIIKGAQEAEDSIKTLTYPQINSLKNSLNKYKSDLPDDDFKAIESAFNHLKASADGQVNLLEKFNVVTIDDGTSIGDKVDQIKTDYDGASSVINDLENKWDI